MDLEFLDVGLNEIVKELRCPICSGENLIKNGNRKRKEQKSQQIKCKDCGKFFLAEYLYFGADPNLDGIEVLETYLKYKSYNRTAQRFAIARETVRKIVRGYGMDPYQTGEKGCEVAYEWGSKTKYKNPWELEDSDAYYYLGR